MITSPAFAGKRYAILGLARSGLAAAEALLASGAEVLAWDRQDNAREKLAGRCTLADPLEADLTGFDGVVVSPGVPLNTHPIVERAASFGVPVIGDIELFALARASLPEHKVVGITGTNGKSTTTALVYHICETAGMPTLMGGNIGLPILAQDPLAEGGVNVLELSSYQIDLTQSLACDVALLLNVTPDHLDRYDGFEAYRASKMRLFSMLQTNAVSIDASGDPELDQLFRAIPSPEGGVHLRLDPTTEINLSTAPSLQGPHNQQNALAAIAVAQALGIDDDTIGRALVSFEGLPHRMERVGEWDGVLFVNDSKATNADSTAPALAAYPPDPQPRIHWIVGGLAKEDGLGACEPHIGNVAAAYTIGESGPRFAELLNGRVPVENSELICEAVKRAKESAKPGDVVLLSPACASFDQFRDYEKRGEHFREIVHALCAEGTPPAHDERLSELGRSAA